jgi:hypothetical protein
MTVTQSPSAGLDALRARAQQVVITTSLTSTTLQVVAADPTILEGVFVIQGDYTTLILCLNVLVEVSGYVDKQSVQTLGMAVATALQKFPAVEASQWRSILS